MRSVAFADGADANRSHSVEVPFCSAPSADPKADLTRAGAGPIGNMQNRLWDSTRNHSTQKYGRRLDEKISESAIANEREEEEEQVEGSLQE